jgi:hypothetical protein
MRNWHKIGLGLVGLLLALAIALPAVGAPPGGFFTDVLVVISSHDSLPKAILGQAGFSGAKRGHLWLYDEERRDAGLYNEGGELYVFDQSGNTKLVSTDALSGSDLTLTGDLSVGDDSTLTDDVTIGGNLLVTGTTQLGGNVSSQTGGITLTDNVTIDGASDSVQLLVQGYVTQTNYPLIVEQSGGVDLFKVSNSGSADVALDLSVSRDAIVDDVLNVDDTVNQATGTSEVSISGSFYVFSPTATLTATLGSTGVNDGDLLWVTNRTTETVVIVDTGATIGGGNLSLGQYDVLGFVYLDSKWMQMYAADNS